MKGQGISFDGPVNSGEAVGHRSKLEVVLTLITFDTLIIEGPIESK